MRANDNIACYYFGWVVCCHVPFHGAERIVQYLKKWECRVSRWGLPPERVLVLLTPLKVGDLAYRTGGDVLSDVYSIKGRGMKPLPCFGVMVGLGYRDPQLLSKLSF